LFDYVCYSIIIVSPIEAQTQTQLAQSKPNKKNEKTENKKEKFVFEILNNF